MFDAIPPIMVICWWMTFGLFVGSFLNVAIYRLPIEGETVARPVRSRCPACKTELTWSENIPILSWVFLRGRCRTCGTRISVRYPMVEALTALLWGLAAASLPPEAWQLIGVRVLVLSGLVVATFVDFDYFEIDRRNVIHLAHEIGERQLADRSGLDEVVRQGSAANLLRLECLAELVLTDEARFEELLRDLVSQLVVPPEAHDGLPRHGFSSKRR